MRDYAVGVPGAGLVRVMVTEIGDEFSVYFTPISIDPEKPAMPISHPGYYSTYLAKKIGPFSTLGLAEDTWALNEKVTDDATFWRQSFDIDGERRKMFFAALDKLRSGSLVCVFDGTDRIQLLLDLALTDMLTALAALETVPQARLYVRHFSKGQPPHLAVTCFIRGIIYGTTFQLQAAVGEFNQSDQHIEIQDKIIRKEKIKARTCLAQQADGCFPGVIKHFVFRNRTINFQERSSRQAEVGADGATLPA